MITINIFTDEYLNDLIDWFKSPENRKFMTTKSINIEQARVLVKSDDNKKCFVIKNNGVPIGYCMLKEIKTHPKIGIMIDENFQGEGHGIRAMELLHNQAKELGCKRLGLMVKSENKKAVKFYDKLGYKTTNFIMEIDI